MKMRISKFLKSLSAVCAIVLIEPLLFGPTVLYSCKDREEPCNLNLNKQECLKYSKCAWCKNGCDSSTTTTDVSVVPIETRFSGKNGFDWQKVIFTPN